MRAAITQLRDHKLGLVHADRCQRPDVFGHAGVHECGEHVPDRDRVQCGGHEDRKRGNRRVGTHRVLRRQRVGNDVRQRAVVANRPGEHVWDAMRHERVHDAGLGDALRDGLFDRAGTANRVDRPHVQAVPAFDAFAFARHPERRTEDRRFEIVHGDGISPEHRAHVAVLDEPDHVLARARMHQRGSDHPQNLAAAGFLFAEQLCEHAVIHRPLARHLGGHEAEFVGAVRPA